MAIRPLRTALALVAVCALAHPAAAQTNTPEIEPNDSKANALANGPITLAHGDSVSGESVAATGAGLDYFLIRTAPLPPGIYRHRLVLTSDTPGHVATIRALNQTAATAAVWPGTLGVAGTTDSTAQTALNGVVQWYGFGRGEQIYYRVTGTAATTAPYTATLETEQVFSILDCGVWQPGAITISTVPPGHGNDVDLMIYDSDFNPIAGYANDGASTNSGHTTNTNLPAHLRRHFEPGEYYVVSSNFDLMNNLGSPCDDNRRTGLIMDFADCVVAGSTTAPLHLHFTISDGLGSSNFAGGLVTTQFNSTKSSAFEVRWHRFVVGGATTGACCLPDGSCAITTHERCEIVLAGSFNGAGTDCTACPAPPTDQWIDRALAPYTRVGAGGAIIGGNFYLLSGSNASAIRVTDCYRYDIVNNAWRSIAPMPHAGSASPQLGGISNFDAAAIGTDIYVVGGFTGPAATVPPLSRLLKYDTLTDSWEDIVTDPYPIAIYGAGVVAHGGLLYVISGATLASPLTYTDACYVYNPAAPAGTRWSAIAPIPVGRFASVAVVGNRIYAAASGAAVEHADRVDVYDIATDTWSQAPNMSNLRAGCALYSWDGRPYAVSGGLTTYLGSSEVLDGGAWVTGPVPVHGARSFAFDGNHNWLVRSTGFNGVYRAFTEVMRVEGGAEPTGACCLGTSCIITTLENCTINGWAYMGDGVSCEPDPCSVGPATGACCNGTVCGIATATDCANGGGVYQGDGTACGAPGNPTTCCPANWNGVGGVEVQDIFEFLSQWFAGNPDALNFGGVPGVPAIFAFLTVWFAGCG